MTIPTADNFIAARSTVDSAPDLETKFALLDAIADGAVQALDARTEEVAQLNEEIIEQHQRIITQHDALLASMEGQEEAHQLLAQCTGLLEHATERIRTFEALVKLLPKRYQKVFAGVMEVTYDSHGSGPVDSAQLN